MAAERLQRHLFVAPLGTGRALEVASAYVAEMQL
jgi:hypothetical protein